MDAQKRPGLDQLLLIRLWQIYESARAFPHLQFQKLNLIQDILRNFLALK